MWRTLVFALLCSVVLAASELSGGSKVGAWNIELAGHFPIHGSKAGVDLVQQFSEKDESKPNKLYVEYEKQKKLREKEFAHLRKQIKSPRMVELWQEYLSWYGGEVGNLESNKMVLAHSDKSKYPRDTKQLACYFKTLLLPQAFTAKTRTALKKESVPETWIRIWMEIVDFHIRGYFDLSTVLQPFTDPHSHALIEAKFTHRNYVVAQLMDNGTPVNCALYLYEELLLTKGIPQVAALPKIEWVPQPEMTKEMNDEWVKPYAQQRAQAAILWKVLQHNAWRFSEHDQEHDPGMDPNVLLKPTTLKDTFVDPKSKEANWKEAGKNTDTGMRVYLNNKQNVAAKCYIGVAPVPDNPVMLAFMGAEAAAEVLLQFVGHAIVSAPMNQRRISTEPRYGLNEDGEEIDRGAIPVAVPKIVPVIFWEKQKKGDYMLCMLMEMMMGELADLKKELTIMSLHPQDVQHAGMILPQIWKTLKEPDPEYKDNGWDPNLPWGILHMDLNTQNILFENRGLNLNEDTGKYEGIKRIEKIWVFDFGTNYDRLIPRKGEKSHGDCDFAHALLLNNWFVVKLPENGWKFWKGNRDSEFSLGHRLEEVYETADCYNQLDASQYVSEKMKYLEPTNPPCTCENLVDVIVDLYKRTGQYWWEYNAEHQQNKAYNVIEFVLDGKQVAVEQWDHLQDFGNVVGDEFGEFGIDEAYCQELLAHGAETTLLRHESKMSLFDFEDVIYRANSGQSSSFGTGRSRAQSLRSMRSFASGDGLDSDIEFFHEEPEEHGDGRNGPRLIGGESPHHIGEEESQELPRVAAAIGNTCSGSRYTFQLIGVNLCIGGIMFYLGRRTAPQKETVYTPLLV